MTDDKILKSAKIAEKQEKEQNCDNEERMRVLANLIIDRVLEDKKNGKLRFKEV